MNLVFDLIFLSEWGIVAGAVGTDIAYTLYVGAHLWICKRLLGLELARCGPACPRAGRRGRHGRRAGRVRDG